MSKNTSPKPNELLARNCLEYSGTAPVSVGAVVVVLVDVAEDGDELSGAVGVVGEWSGRSPLCQRAARHHEQTNQLQQIRVPKLICC